MKDFQNKLGEYSKKTMTKGQSRCGLLSRQNNRKDHKVTILCISFLVSNVSTFSKFENMTTKLCEGLIGKSREVRLGPRWDLLEWRQRKTNVEFQEAEQSVLEAWGGGLSARCPLVKNGETSKRGF